MISKNDIVAVNASASVVAAKAVDITAEFYRILFRESPELLPFFNRTNQSSGRQRLALAAAVIAFAQHINNLGVLDSMIDLVAHKHCALNILPEHYSIVTKHLVQAISLVLSEDLMPYTICAWNEALNELSKRMYTREEALYKAAEGREGGWRGAEAFTIAEKKFVTESTCEITFRPAASRQFQFTPGQFITVSAPCTAAILVLCCAHLQSLPTSHRNSMARRCGVS